MISFVKMQGIGNDFIMLDALRDGLPEGDLRPLARAMNDRRLGVGGDGLILLEAGEIAPFRMRMFNPDGSESEMCGNGIRCLAKLVREHLHSDADSFDVETGAGLLALTLTADGQVRVDMGLARLSRGEIGMTGPADETFVDRPVSAAFCGTAVSMGNPHLVIFVPDVAAVDLARFGPELEHHPQFPNRVNVHFVQVADGRNLIQRTWERGAGITLACGTGACAVGVAGFLTGRSDREVSIQLPGGTLRVDYAEDGRVWMTGPAERVFTGTF